MQFTEKKRVKRKFASVRLNSTHFHVTSKRSKIRAVMLVAVKGLVVKAVVMAEDEVVAMC